MSNIRLDKILGSRRLSNYCWATIILLGGLGFVLVGLSSYLNTQLYPLINYIDLNFLPQGIIMTFYGTIGIIISFFLWYTILLDVGSGYNEFNNEKGLITIFRLGFPGKNRIIQLNYDIKEIYSIKVKIKEGLSPKKDIYLTMKDKREIPITKVGQPVSLSNIEEQASNLAKFLGVILEGIE